jgi:hypothetical protein
VQSQILVWCGDERLDLGYDGSFIAVPPMNEIAKVGIRSPYRLPAATTKAGVPLPGTVIVEDVIVQKEDGGYKKIFDVSDLCAFLERDCPELFQRGFQIVSDPEDVKAVQMEGRPLYEASQDARARDILGLELSRRKRYEDAGQPAPPGSNEQDVIWAIRHQQMRAARKAKTLEVSSADIYAAMAGTYTGPTPGVEADAPIVESTEQVSASSMIDEADELGVSLTKADLSGLIRGDKDIYAYVAEKLKIKREQLEPRSA